MKACDFISEIIQKSDFFVSYSNSEKLKQGETCYVVKNAESISR